MKILQAKASNYRNIDGISVFFNEATSYIIGDNEIGKTNFLELLKTVCDGDGFRDSDFRDPEKPIIVELAVKAHPNEQGPFGTGFDERIRFKQKISESHPEVSAPALRKTLKARSRMPISFLSYTAKDNKDMLKGAGILLSLIIDKYFASDDKGELQNILPPFFDGFLGSIGDFTELEAAITVKTAEMIKSLMPEKSHMPAEKFTRLRSVASVSLLSEINKLYASKAVPFSSRLYPDEGDMLTLPLAFAIDEPEIHLHPYMQRTLISHYTRILNNEDEQFLELLKVCFGVDRIDGQLIIVTHSTDSLVGDYRNLIRFYRHNAKTAVVSGSDAKVSFEPKIEKHIIMRFPEIKEAFYANCALLVEGETEYGCIEAFASKLGVSLDENGICLINARGEGSIRPLRQLLKAFRLPSAAIYDGDVKLGNTASSSQFYTKEPCFEMEIAAKLFDNNKQSLAMHIALEIDPVAARAPINMNAIGKPLRKLGLDASSESPGYISKPLSEVDVSSRDEFCIMLSAFLMTKKGVFLGRTIGEALSESDIPDSYVRAIKNAVELANKAYDGTVL
jgi:putative ATP-dependent endonuclease of OLD family